MNFSRGVGNICMAGNFPQGVDTSARRAGRSGTSGENYSRYPCGHQGFSGSRTLPYSPAACNMLSASTIQFGSPTVIHREYFTHPGDCLH